MRFAVVVSLLVLAVHGQQVDAQSVDSLTAGARVRVRGDRATNDGVRHFVLRGVVASNDSGQLVLRTGAADARLDTVAFVGMQRLEVFAGKRPRGRRILIGAATFGAVATAGWLVARQTLEPEWRDVRVDDPTTHAVRVDHVIGPPPSMVSHLRTSIPIAVVVGGALGSVLGTEIWNRVRVPQSVYPEAR